MNGEIDIGGVFVHPLLVAAMIAFPLARMIEWLLDRTGFYQIVWHRPLFDVAITVLIWASVSSWIVSGDPAALFGW